MTYLLCTHNQPIRMNEAVQLLGLFERCLRFTGLTNEQKGKKKTNARGKVKRMRT